MAWTTAAVLIILLGFFGGMVFRTSLTTDPNPAAGTIQTENQVEPAVRNAQNS